MPDNASSDDALLPAIPTGKQFVVSNLPSFLWFTETVQKMLL